MGGGIKDEDWGDENNSVAVAQPSQNKLLGVDSNSNQKHGTMAKELIIPDPKNPDNTTDDLTEMGEVSSAVPILMSERNKETLRNIRLRQLQRDCPHTRDFYNLTLKIREANQGNKPVEVKSLMQKLYPFFRWGNAEEDGERAYQPALSSDELAISLGKIKIYSPCAPKNCLDPELSEKLRLGVGPTVPFSADPSKARMRHVYRQIEALYGYLLTYEESEARISLLKYKSDFDEDLRHGALDKATRILMDSELLRNITKVEKGRMVVSRLMAVMDPSMGAKLITSLIPSFASWELDSDRKTQQVYIRFSFCIYITKQVDFQIILTALSDDAMSAMILFELGSSFLMMVLLHGQQLYDEAAPDGEFQKIWKKFFEMATHTFGQADSLIPPIEIFPEFLNRLKGDDKFTSPESRQYWQNLFQICKDNGSIVSEGF